jgi:GTP cyclohydrolase I
VEELRRYAALVTSGETSSVTSLAEVPVSRDLHEEPPQRAQGTDHTVTRTPLSADLPAAARAIEAFLRALGHAPESDPELASTGKLVAAAFHDELLAGYRLNPAEILAQSMPSQSQAMVVVRGIDVVCICPHHLLPAAGVVHVGYLPSDRLVGFGALAKLVRCYAQRLTLQEALCDHVANALIEHLGAAAAGCIADLSPACLTCRGERPAQARAVSFATAGRMQSDAALRAEFLALALEHGPGVNMEQSR